MSKKLFAVALLLSIAVVGFAVTPDQMAQIQALRQGWVQPVEGGSVLWKQAPTEVTGWYWMYDGTCGTNGDVPFVDPVMPALPTWNDITSAGAAKLAPYNDRPFAYVLTDSFWYYGHWYKPGDNLYISPDGWASFDPAIKDDGSPNPPTTVPPIPNIDAPNELFAALWADYNPTLTAEPSNTNRVWYIDASMLAQAGGILIQWNQIKSASGPGVYSFQLGLATGGQIKLDIAGECGVIFSRHYIHFIYNSASPNWTADNARTGIENQGGTAGIWYQGTISNNRAVRAGYKKIFKHDVKAYSFLSPGPVVLRWTKIEPKVVLANVGTEAEHFTATVDIYDENDSIVYHNVLGAYDLMPFAYDTAVLPCWTPGEIGQSYTKKLGLALATDECHFNDTLARTSFVHCDDTFRYDWNFGDGPGVGWGIGTDYFMTWYGVDGGVLVTGGRSYSYDADPIQDKGQLALFKGQTAGCGAPNTVPIASATAETHQTGWNKAMFGNFGVWAPSGTPGGLFIGLTTSNSNGYGQTGWYEEYGLNSWPGPNPCYQGAGPGRGAYLSGSTFYWDANSGSYYTCALELFVHLGFGEYPLSPQPAPPCYYGEAHDISAYDITRPNKPYVEAGATTTPEIAIVNIGRQKEPSGSGFIPVKFFAKMVSTDSIVFADSSLINKIGYLADPTDDPDTLMVAIPVWTPTGKCDNDKANIGVEYELIGLVQLGEIGPDESDHCPYNDTARRTVTALLKHDVGVTAIANSPDFDNPPDRYNAGTIVTFTATVENFGFNQENNVPVKIDIVDKTASPDTLVWSNSQAITTLDWRGNTLGNPYTADIVFPVFTVPTTNWLTVTCKTELPGDLCPDNDFEVMSINSGLEESPIGLPFSLESATSSGVTFTLPTTANVSVKIYDISGKLVTTLVSGSQTPGRHEIRWNGTDNAGRTVAKGIYLVRMDSESFNATKKVVVF